MQKHPGFADRVRFSLLQVVPALAVLLAAPPSPVGMTLAEALELGLQHNHALQRSRIDAEAAGQQVEEAWSSVYPRLDLTLRYTRTVESPDPFAGSDAGGFFDQLAAVGWLAFNESARTDGIDYIQQLRERGQSKADAIINGGATRLRPVLLTAMTTVLGLIPLTFGINIDFIGLATTLDPDFRIGSANTQFWGPMGIAIVSGLTFATFLTLVIVPVMYSLSDSLTRRVMIAFGREPG